MLRIVASSFAILTFVAFHTYAQSSGKRSTNAAPPKREVLDYSPRNLAIEVPDPPEKYKYTVTGTVDGIVYHPSKVPYYEFEDKAFSQRQVGELGVGSEVKLEKIRSRAGRIYYGIEYKEKVGNKELTKVGWIDGVYVQTSGASSKPSVK